MQVCCCPLSAAFMQTSAKNQTRSDAGLEKIERCKSAGLLSSHM